MSTRVYRRGKGRFPEDKNSGSAAGSRPGRDPTRPVSTVDGTPSPVSEGFPLYRYSTLQRHGLKGRGAEGGVSEPEVEFTYIKPPDPPNSLIITLGFRK